jgi:hypothetical protein
MTTTIKLLQDNLTGEYMDGGYSGRGMYGERCVAFKYDTEKEAIQDMLSAVHELSVDCAEDDSTDLGDFVDEMKRFQFDSLYPGVVLYFSQLKVEEHGRDA